MYKLAHIKIKRFSKLVLLTQFYNIIIMQYYIIFGLLSVSWLVVYLCVRVCPEGCEGPTTDLFDLRISLRHPAALVYSS